MENDHLPHQDITAEIIDMCNGLGKIHTLVEMRLSFNGYVTSHQNGVSYLDGLNKRISIWGDMGNTMFAKIIAIDGDDDTQVTSDFKVSNNGREMSHTQTWVDGQSDDPNCYSVFETEKLGQHSMDDLKITIAELKEARKGPKPSFLGRLTAKFCSF